MASGRSPFYWLHPAVFLYLPLLRTDANPTNECYGLGGKARAQIAKPFPWLLIVV